MILPPVKNFPSVVRSHLPPQAEGCPRKPPSVRGSIHCSSAVHHGGCKPTVLRQFSKDRHAAKCVLRFSTRAGSPFSPKTIAPCCRRAVRFRRLPTTRFQTLGSAVLCRPFCLSATMHPSKKANLSFCQTTGRKPSRVLALSGSNQKRDLLFVCSL